MILITAIDKNWGIGKNNKLLYSLPEDMAFFKILLKFIRFSQTLQFH